MLDPVTATAMITGIVGAYKAYTEYKAAVAKAAEAKTAAPAKDTEAAKGELVAPSVKQAVAAHGGSQEQATLQLFEQNPATFQSALVQLLSELAGKNSAFAGQLQTIAQQASIQTGGAQGTVNVSDNAKVYGAAVGSNTGTISGTYTINDRDDEKK